MIQGRSNEDASVEVPDELIDAFKTGKVILFVGSGLSSFTGGYPTAGAFGAMLRNQVVSDTDGTSRRLASLIGDQDSHLGLTDVAEYFELFASPGRLFEVVKQTYNNKTISPASIHRDLWELPNTKHIYTTNFDPLIEDGLGLSRTRAAPRVIIDPNEFRDLTAEEYLVFKLHGCAVRSQSRADLVITRSDYLRFEGMHPLTKLKAQMELVQNVFLFLGYSLDDSTFQSLYTEIRLFAGQSGRAGSCFAVMPGVSAAKVAFWKRLGLHILNGTAQSLVRSIQDHQKLRLHTSWFEWRKKEGARDDTKQAIAQKALSDILSGVDVPKGTEHLTITLLLDSGTSTLAVARRLKDLLDRDPDSIGPIQAINILTNCTAILDTLRWIHLPTSGKKEYSADGKTRLPSLGVWVIGGKLRTETQALVTPAIATEDKSGGTTTSRLLESFLATMGAPSGVIALMGATAIAHDGFRTNTVEEKNVKREMINSAKTVIFLVDHSKFLEDGNSTFLSFEDAKDLKEKKDKTIIVLTDRRPPLPTAEGLKNAKIDLRVVAGDPGLVHTSSTEAKAAHSGTK
jgi:DeoR/GlpR family transcriptional regulator of sugar metabolism